MPQEELEISFRPIVAVLSNGGLFEQSREKVVQMAVPRKPFVGVPSEGDFSDCVCAPAKDLERTLREDGTVTTGRPDHAGACSLATFVCMRVRSCVAGEFADLDRVSGWTLAGDGHGCVVVATGGK